MDEKKNCTTDIDIDIDIAREKLIFLSTNDWMRKGTVQPLDPDAAVDRL